MHAVPITYKGHIVLPLAVGILGSYASLVVITYPDGSKRASGILANVPDEGDACCFAIKFAKWDINGRRGPRPIASSKRARKRYRPPTDDL